MLALGNKAVVARLQSRRHTFPESYRVPRALVPSGPTPVKLADNVYVFPACGTNGSQAPRFTLADGSKPFCLKPE